MANYTIVIVSIDLGMPVCKERQEQLDALLAFLHEKQYHVDLMLTGEETDFRWRLVAEANMEEGPHEPKDHTGVRRP